MYHLFKPLSNQLFFVGNEVLTTVVKKSSIFWDITLCSLSKVNRRFEGTYLHLHGRRKAQQEIIVKAGGKVGLILRP
jgi:hypothetical protein